MKKFLFILMGLFVMAAAFAAGENIPTSKSYVDSKLAEKQDPIPANDGAAQVLTNTGTTGEYGTKGIYDATGEYTTQTQNLVDAATMNAGVQNAIDSEFQCIEWDENNECLLMQLGGITQVPAGYTQLEYLESTGTQWIDTGITTNNNLGIHIDFQYTNSNTNEQILFGHVAPNFCIWRGNSKFSYGYTHASGPTGIFEVDSSELTARHIFELNFNNNGIAKFDNITNQLPKRTFSNNRTTYLFASHYGAQAYHGGPSRIFSAQITNNLTMVRNFIPARRNSDGALGMYDTVSNTFFTNNGTGEFIAGPVVYLPHGE